MRFLALILTSVLLAGCSSFPKKMVGSFDSRVGDFLIIKADGALYWSPISKIDDKLVFVGIVSPERKDSLVAPLVVPSSSPFLYSKITFSPDYAHVTVDWGGLNHDAGKNRATEYERRK